MSHLQCLDGIHTRAASHRPSAGGPSEPITQLGCSLPGRGSRGVSTSSADELLRLGLVKQHRHGYCQRYVAIGGATSLEGRTMFEAKESSKKIVLLSLGAVAAASVIVPATVAWANPAGCSNSSVGGTSSIGELQESARGTCAGNATRTMQAEIKRDIANYPDALVSKNDRTVYGTRYSTPTSACDHGMTAVYYGRGFFTVESTYADTAHTMQHTCS